MPHFQIREARFDTGEHYPFLMRDGEPMFYPCVYTTCMLRGRNLAYNTLARHQNSIKQLYTWASISKIDVESRTRTGAFFEEREIDAIVRACRAPYETLVKLLEERKPKAPSVVNLESFRQKAPPAPAEVIGHTAATRVRDIRDYLDWLASVMMLRTSKGSGSYAAFEAMRTSQKKAFDARIPKTTGSKPREGLDRETADRLMAVLNPEHADNPWRNDKGLAQRNQAMIQLLYTQGIRRGELLGIKIGDIDPSALTLTIHRRPDDPDDRRHAQPNTKTRARVLPLQSAVFDMLMNYIVVVRRQIPNARKHTFLFVTHKKGRDQGEALSKSAYQHIIATLRDAVPELPYDFSGHILRHSWNERYSELCDKNGTKIEREMAVREYLMGWKPGSGQARTYTQRHTREAAKKASLNIQQGILGGHDE